MLQSPSLGFSNIVVLHLIPELTFCCKLNHVYRNGAANLVLALTALEYFLMLLIAPPEVMSVPQLSGR